MKRVLFCLMVLAASAASAQDDWGSRWSVTPKVGLNISTMSGEPFPIYFETFKFDEMGDVNTRVGLRAGVEAEWRMNKWIGLSLGASYSQLGYSTDVTTTTSTSSFIGGRNIENNLGGICLQAGDKVYRSLEHTKRLSLHYVVLPVKVHAHLWRGLTVSAGLQYGRLLYARQVGDRQEVHGTVSDDGFVFHSDLSIYYEVACPPLSTDGLQDVERSSDSFSHGHLSQCNRNEVSIPIGVSYEWRHVVLAADYNLGLSNLSKENDYKQHNRSLSLTLGYRFEL